MFIVRGLVFGLIVMAFVLLIPTTAFSQSVGAQQLPPEFGETYYLEECRPGATLVTGICQLMEGFGEPIYLEEKKIPDWVRNIFLWYGQGDISESELLQTIQYLIKNKILTVESTGQGKFSDSGDFKLVFNKTNNLIFQEYEDILNPLFNGAVKDFNSRYSLPHDITIEVKDCGFQNAYYDSSNQKLVICYELIEGLDYYHSLKYDSKESKVLGVMSTISFILMHEIGHVLVDVNNLPITGNAETAVDQFAATYFLQNSNNEYAKTTLKVVATWFGDQGLEKFKNKNFIFSDEHPFELQRFYDLACLTYGSDPADTSLVSNGLIPKERADRCPHEYYQAERSWNILLEPFQK